jgi:RP/EB family microtubule-associated protein
LIVVAIFFDYQLHYYNDYHCYFQFLDIMYPNTVPMNKVNWSASKDFEYLGNYKILQTCFTKLNIDRYIDVDRLISGKYMDNLEFMQWFKRYFELTISDKGDYDCLAQRAKGKGGATMAHSSSSKPSSVPTAIKTSTAVRPTVKISAPASKPSSAPIPKAITITKKSTSAAVLPVTTATVKAPDNSKLITLNAEIEELKIANENSNQAFSDLRVDMDGLEKERDFYFDKLRDIEIILQDIDDSGKGSELTAAVFKILYATQVSSFLRQQNILILFFMV